jgi:acetyl-CoA synthetase
VATAAGPRPCPRRLLQDVAEERQLGDTTTLADPAVVEEIKQRAVSAPPEE